MKSIKFYEYKKCSTCQSAAKYLERRGFIFERIPIVEQPPNQVELKYMLERIKGRGGSFKNLFNKSGQVYRELGLAEKIKNGMTENEALRLLAQNGKLIKRPFVLFGPEAVIGFNREEWGELVHHV